MLIPDKSEFILEFSKTNEEKNKIVNLNSSALTHFTPSFLKSTLSVDKMKISTPFGYDNNLFLENKFLQHCI